MLVFPSGKPLDAFTAAVFLFMAVLILLIARVQIQAKRRKWVLMDSTTSQLLARLLEMKKATFNVLSVYVF